MKVSIIIPLYCQNERNIEITKVCLDSLQSYTKDYQLILVDDGSTQQAHEYFKSVPKMDLIHNETSKGFPAAVNQGIERALNQELKSDYIVILNNDLVLTPHWLERMIEHFEVDATLGLLGCTTNRVEGYQHVDYNAEGVDFQYADVITGFCMMFPKEILNKLKEQEGYYLDTRFGKGGQEDSDLSFRIQKLGYKVGIARNVYMHHYGSMSFREVFNNDAFLSKQYAQSRVQILRDKYPQRTMEKQQEGSIKAQEKNVGTAIKKRMVMIAIPTLGTVRVELIPRLIHYSRNPNYNVVILPETPILQPLDHARNWWVKKFLEISNDPEDVLLWCDDDIIPPFDAIDRIMSHNKDIVGGTCFVMKSQDGEYFPYPVALRYNENKEFIAYFGQALERVDGTGGGFIAVKRKVYESMDRPYEYKYYPDGTLELVADFQFCQKAAEKGWEIWYDFNTVCDHIKAISIKGINDLLIKVQQESQQQNR